MLMFKILVFFLGTLILAYLINIIVSRALAANIWRKMDRYGDNAVVDGVVIHYVKKGEGKPLVMLHGLMGSHILFMQTADALSCSYTVYVIDLLGFGLSDKSPVLDYTRKGMAEQVMKFMKHEGVQHFDLLGNSMGGEVALSLAINYPESIDRLILCDSAGYMTIQINSSLLLKSRRLFSLLIKYLLLTYPFFKLFYYKTFYNRNLIDLGLLKQSFALAFRIPPETLMSFYCQSDSGLLSEKIAELNNPALIVWGNKDKFIPLSDAYRFKSDIHESRLAVIKNCGHVPFLEKPDEFLEAVCRFLGQSAE